MAFADVISKRGQSTSIRLNLRVAVQILHVAAGVIDPYLFPLHDPVATLIVVSVLRCLRQWRGHLQGLQGCRIPAIKQYGW